MLLMRRTEDEHICSNKVGRWADLDVSEGTHWPAGHAPNDHAVWAAGVVEQGRSDIQLPSYQLLRCCGSIPQIVRCAVCRCTYNWIICACSVLCALLFSLSVSLRCCLVKHSGRHCCLSRWKFLLIWVLRGRFQVFVGMSITMSACCAARSSVWALLCRLCSCAALLVIHSVRAFADAQALNQGFTAVVLAIKLPGLTRSHGAIAGMRMLLPCVGVEWLRGWQVLVTRVLGSNRLRKRPRRQLWNTDAAGMWQGRAAAVSRSLGLRCLLSLRRAGKGCLLGGHSLPASSNVASPCPVDPACISPSQPLIPWVAYHALRLISSWSQNWWATTWADRTSMRCI